MYDFAKEMHFDVRGQGGKSTRDQTLIKLLKSPAIMDSKLSNIIFLSSDPNDLCDRITLLLQEKNAGNNSDFINKEIFASLDKLLENKCLSKKQHRQILVECNLLHE